MRRSIVILVALVFGTLLWVPTLAGSGDDARPSAALGGCNLFPEDNIWNVPIDTLPRDQRSDTWVGTIGPSKHLHPDFGSGFWPPESDSPIGIPFVTVAGAQSKVPVSFRYADESDPGPYPIPADAPIEGGASGTGDRHVLVLDTSACRLYELYKAYPQNGGTSWRADSGAVFDLNSNALRPDGWTSADAAGLPILPGLVRYDEVEAGEISHAIRFTVPQTQKAYVWPARHYASSLTSTNYPPMGLRFRLRQDYDVSGFHPQVQVILRALKKYGMILADNGSAWYISGAPDPRWDNEILAQLKVLQGSDFEAVNVESLMKGPDSAAAVTDSTAIYFPHLGTGTGGGMVFQSEIVLVNNDADAFARVEFFDQQGAPWTVSLADHGSGSEFLFPLNRGRHLVLTTTGESPIQVGYARISSGTGVHGTAILRGRDSASGITLFEAGVPSADLQSEFTVFLDSIGDNDTGLALLNPPSRAGHPTGSPATVKLELYDDAFELVGEEEIQLEAGQYLPRFVYQLLSDPQASSRAREMRGILAVKSDTPVAALTLRQGDKPGIAFPNDVPTLTVFPVMPGHPALE